MNGVVGERTTFQVLCTAARASLLGVLAFTWAASPGWGAGPGAPVGRLSERLQDEARRGLLLEHGGGEIEVDLERGRLIVTGPNIHLRLGRAAELFAEGGLVLWGRFEGGKIKGLESLYAEGNVFVRLYEQSFACERVFLDLVAGRGEFEEAIARSPAPDDFERRRRRLRLGVRARRAALQVRADRVELSDGLERVRAKHARISTCTFWSPHWALSARELTLVRKEDADGGAAYSGRVDHARFEVLGAPILPLPWSVPWEAEWQRWLPRVRAGEARRFGPYVRSAWPLWPGERLDFNLLADWLDKRGPAGGLSGAWRIRNATARHEGDLLGWYVRDRGLDRFALEPPRADRGRVSLFQRDDWNEALRTEIELGWLSDLRVLREFYEPEAKRGREINSTAYLRWRGGNRALSAMGRVRLNDFQTQVEHLPRIRFDWLSLPLWAGAWSPYFAVSYRGGLSRVRYDPTRTVSDRLEKTVERADLDHRLDWPLDFGLLRFVPYAGARWTGFSEVLDPDQNERVRTTLSAGLVASTDVWREFAIGDRLVLRHIMTPRVAYEDVFHNDLLPEELIPIDEVEEVRKGSAIVFGIRNRLQVHGLDANGRVRLREVLDLRVMGRYFPDRVPAGARRWDRIDVRVRLEPLPGMWFRARGDWEPEQGSRERLSAALGLRLHPDVLLSGSYFAFRRDFEAVGARLAYRVWPRWGVALSTQYDFVSGRFVSHRLELRRHLHRFVLQLSFDADFGEKDFRFGVTFSPAVLFRDPLARSEPWRNADSWLD